MVSAYGTGSISTYYRANSLMICFGAGIRLFSRLSLKRTRFDRPSLASHALQQINEFIKMLVSTQMCYYTPPHMRWE